MDKENELKAEESSTENAANDDDGMKGEKLHLRFMWNKTNYEIDDLGTLNTVADLRNKIEEKTGIPTVNQKIMFKGLVKDDSATLEATKLTNNSKLMVVGSTAKDIETIKTITPQEIKKVQQAEAAASKEPLCKQKMHVKVLEKGKPDDVPVGIKGVKEKLPSAPLSGFINKAGGKVRLTFKLELDQLWLGTKERTEKLPMSSIRNVVSEPIEGHEGYHILALQLGPTEASRYWLYWFPSQYVDAIKDTVLGKWQVLN